ncbi:hypothetical protein E2C01_070828 [Portunus trituberculatus]|uniref:Uncharacterized protein n=1 Tax=Portunus trituberculatus TaxID=210409 RepID=A0A5B7I6D1_PORTR|nr:hypothetical protein [Portunus trituberculatus]
MRPHAKVSRWKPHLYNTSMSLLGGDWEEERLPSALLESPLFVCFPWRCGKEVGRPVLSFTIGSDQDGCTGCRDS